MYKITKSILLFKDQDSSTKKKTAENSRFKLMKDFIKEGGLGESGFSFMETGKTSLVLILQM